MKNMTILFKLISSLLCLVSIFLALRDSSAYAHEVSEIKDNKLTEVGENGVPSQKVLADVSTTKTMLRGRKMIMYENMRKELTKGEDKKASKVSGNYASKRTTTKSKGHSIDQGSKSHNNREQASKDESQRLFDEAADEIAKLMRKDYYRGDVKPRHKPPINNGKPNH